MNLSDRELAKRIGDSVEIRPEPLRLRFRLSDLACADSHLLRILFSCSIQALDNPIERQALVETFLSTRSSVTADDLVEHFHPTLRLAASRITPQKTAAQWIDDSTHADLLDALRKAADPLEFDAGLKLLPPLEIVLESDTLQRERIEQMQRKVAERRAAGQIEHVQRASELLKQFQQLRQSAPDLSVGAILERLSPGDRGEMYEALLVGASDTAMLWAVAANDLVRIDPRTTPPKAERIPLDHGPFRSVQADMLNGRPILLLGSRHQIILFDPADRSTQVLLDPTTGAQLGFNRVLVHQNRIWATHGELGLRAWDPNGAFHAGVAIPDLPRPTFEKPSSRAFGSIQTIASAARPSQMAGPRNLTVLDSARLIFSIGNRLATIDAATLAIIPFAGPDPEADILAILPDSDRLLIVYDNGTVHVRDRSTLELLEDHPRNTQLCSAALLPWMGENRLLLAHDDGSIDCIGLHDSITTEYRSSYRDIREVTASATTVAAITADRSRLVLWHAWDGRKPYAEVHISALTRHRVADVCFG